MKIQHLFFIHYSLIKIFFKRFYHVLYTIDTMKNNIATRWSGSPSRDTNTHAMLE